MVDKMIEYIEGTVDTRFLIVYSILQGFLCSYAFGAYDLISNLIVVIGFTVFLFLSTTIPLHYGISIVTNNSVDLSRNDTTKVFYLCLFMAEHILITMVMRTYGGL